MISSRKSPFWKGFLHHILVCCVCTQDWSKILHSVANLKPLSWVFLQRSFFSVRYMQYWMHQGVCNFFLRNSYHKTKIFTHMMLAKLITRQFSVISKELSFFQRKKIPFLIGRIEYQRSSKFKFRIDPKESHTRRS